MMTMIDNSVMCNPNRPTRRQTDRQKDKQDEQITIPHKQDIFNSQKYIKYNLQ